MNVKAMLKKIFLAVKDEKRLVLLDYPVTPIPLNHEDSAKPHVLLYDIINKNRSIYEKFLSNSLKYKSHILEIKEDKNKGHETDPGWNNGFFPGLDIITLYSMLAEVNPKKYIEIGSGTSTRVAYKARKDNNLSYTITVIDPFMKKEITDIADLVEKKELQKVSLDHFRSLNAGDVLFFDGTHTLYPNSDVMWFFLEVLPILKPGVYVQVHDVYLPYDYPQFMCDRYYNEQYILAACLLSNPKRYEILCPNYFIYNEKELHNILQPFWEDHVLKDVEIHGGSFWIKMLN